MVVVHRLHAGALGPRAPPHREHRAFQRPVYVETPSSRDTERSQVGKFAQLLQTIGRQRMSEVEQQGRRAVLVYY